MISSIKPVVNQRTKDRAGFPLSILELYSITYLSHQKQARTQIGY